MTPIQIAYFKHFLFDKGIQRIYISMYKYRKLRGDEKGDKSANPESIEQFFKEVHAMRVIMKAFYFPINSDYGFDYWSKLDTQWKEYWDIHKDNFSNDKYVTLRGTFAILRQNWDNKEYWKTESKLDTYKRLGIEQPPVANDDIETVFDVPCSSELPNTDTEAVLEEEKNSIDSNPGSLLEGFIMVDTVNYHGGKKIGSNTVTVNLRNGYRITFSSKNSTLLRKHCYSYVKLLTNKDTREIALIFNHVSGCSVTIKKDSDKNRNIVVNSRDIVMHIHKFYELDKNTDYYILKVTNTIQQDNSTIFKLKYLG